ncbi:MAG: PIN domain-containing protein [Prevotella sp.]|nr:PIN domain-containing protein [Prevotella sp.]
MKKHYLIDTNVVIDMLLNREDADAACAVFDGAERGEYVLHICALSFTTMFYSLRKILTREQRISALTQLREVLEVAPVNSAVIDMALKAGWKDFEDAVQNFSAVADPQITAIITRNTKDFKETSLELVDSLAFLSSKVEE